MAHPLLHGRQVRARGAAALAAGFAVCLTLLASGCATRLIRSTDLYQSYYAEPLRPETASIEYERQGRTHVFRLSGEEYAMGRLYGEQARELGVCGFYRDVFDNFVGMLHGFADGAGLSREDVYAMHAIPGFTETSCSALWMTAGATATGQTIQIRVLDYIMGLGIQANPAVVFFEFHTGHTVANIGWLGLLGVISGMNDAGLAVSEMGYGNPPGETLYGTPMPFLLLDVPRWTDDPAEAAGIIRSRPRTNSYV